MLPFVIEHNYLPAHAVRPLSEVKLRRAAVHAHRRMFRCAHGRR